MPVTRDISLSKKQMILQWLENPIYFIVHLINQISFYSVANYSTVPFHELITSNLHFPPRCREKHFQLNSDQIKHATHFEHTF